MVAEYYAWLSSLSAWIAAPLNAVSAQINVSLVTAFLLGLIASISPCQLTTNASALAYLGNQASRSGRIWPAAGAYLVGKVLVYTLLGMATVVLGRELMAGLVPTVAPVVRKLLGPAMVLLGLLLLGLLRPEFVVGQRLSFWLEDHARGEGTSNAFLLGVAFAFAFCPTLFLLFFGYLIPMSVHDPLGLAFPAVFAAGATLPLFGLIGALALGRERLGLSAAAMRLDRHVSKFAGAIFVLAGVNDTLLYWFL